MKESLNLTTVLLGVIMIILSLLFVFGCGMEIPTQYTIHFNQPMTKTQLMIVNLAITELNGIAGREVYKINNKPNSSLDVTLDGNKVGFTKPGNSRWGGGHCSVQFASWAFNMETIIASRVVVHEFCHCLNIYHVKDRLSIMNESLNNKVFRAELSSEDKQLIVDHTSISLPGGGSGQ